MTGSLMKTLFAKMLSSRFHKAAHFQKLQEALRKVFPPPRSGTPSWLIKACPLVYGQ